jgi:deazaflavin-dependent oxidoreductase (nitroreductase family)
MLITFTGRKTRKVYTTPVRYLKSGDAVWAFTSVENKWWRNLKGGGAVRLRIRGKEGTYQAEVITEAPDKIGLALREFLSQFPQDAPYYDVGLTSDRNPVDTDLERAAARTVWVRAYPQ